MSVAAFRKRRNDPDWIYCPEDFYQKLEIRKYALNTARIYISKFEKFLNHFGSSKKPMELNEDDIRSYLLMLVQQKRSDSYINQSINAIKFYYEIVKEMPNRYYEIERPIKQETLPKVISKAKVLKMIETCPNLKHRCIISLLYSAGLRRAELLNLKISDIDSDRMMIRVEQSKGRKDRYTLLSGTLLTVLRHYFKVYRPKTYLFEGPGNAKYSSSSVARIVTRAAHKAGIQKKSHHICLDIPSQLTS